MAKTKIPSQVSAHAAPLALRPKPRTRFQDIHDDDLPEHELQERLDLREAAKSQYRDFLDKLKALWAPHEAASLELHHRSGLLIAEKMKELENDPAQMRALQSAIADDLDKNRSDVSRELAFVARWPEFDRFKTEEPSITTWSQLKERLAELSRAEKKTSNGTGKPKRSSDKQRDALVDKLQVLREAIGDVKDDFSVRQLATVETITEGILNEIEELAAPLKKTLKPQRD